MTSHSRMSLFAMYIDLNDWWIGYYRGPIAHYVCLFPCCVIRIRRRQRYVKSYGQ